MWREIAQILPVALVSMACAATAVAAPEDTLPPGSVCEPGPATLVTPRGEVTLAPMGPECRIPPDVAGLPRLAPTPGYVLVGRGTPRVVLRAGETVTVRFGSPATEVVMLQTLANPRITTGRSYRLSPTTARWTVRPGSGVVVVTTRLLAPRFGAGATVSATYAFVYRATPRPRAAR